ncbi:MAG: amidohydrolase family protein, partial [Rhodothermales bacterium]|nr:amidohydrolase family protein [Rhodothermales bacterium]
RSLHTAQRLPAVAAVDAARCNQIIAALRTTIQVPTLRLNAFALRPPYGRANWEQALDLLPDEQADAFRSLGESRLASGPRTDTTFARWSMDLTGQMHRADVPIGAGTDTPIGLAIPGYSLHNELAMLVEAGLEPTDVLRSATVTPASFFGLEAEMGLVAEGMRADLILVSGNPLEDIAHLRDIRLVVSKGQVVRQFD